MNETEKLHLLIDLTTEHCGLFHGTGVDVSIIPAADYIVIPIGYRKNKVEEVAVREFVIPVCKECADALFKDEWVLFYCVLCGASRWCRKEFAKLQCRYHILWLNGCKDCTNEFGGIYFQD